MSRRTPPDHRDHEANAGLTARRREAGLPVGAEDPKPLDHWRLAYFTAKGTVEQLLATTEAPDVPDGTALAILDEAADALGRAARFLRHYLPERVDAQMEATKRAMSATTASPRYAIVWPDGEVYGSKFYFQKPAAMKKWEQASRLSAHLRLWDNRLDRFIWGAKIDIDAAEGQGRR